MKEKEGSKDYRKKCLKVILLTSLFGIGLSVYIYLIDNYNVGGICPTNGCAQVAASQYSKLLTIPVSLWGILYYLAMSVISMVLLNGLYEKYLNYFLTVFVYFGAVFTLYLRYLEVFKIGAVCTLCWGSVILMVGICITYYLYRRNLKTL